jgi:hypothetical protein
MVDNVSAYANILPHHLNMTMEEWNKVRSDDWDTIGTIQLGQLTLIEKRNFKDGYVNDFRRNVDGLYFTLTQTKLIISNSLHKYQKGNNYSDFSFSELLKSINSIESATGISAEEFHATNQELAINIITPERLLEYLEFIKDFKGRHYFDPMRTKSGVKYGIKCVLWDYEIKIYDKKEEMKQHYKLDTNENILRFEIKFKRKRKSSLIQTLADFRDKEKLKLMFNKFIQIFQQVHSVEKEDLSLLTSRERELRYAGLNPEFWNYEKQANLNTEKSKRKKYNQIQEKITLENPMQEVLIPALKIKINELLNK